MFTQIKQAIRMRLRMSPAPSALEYAKRTCSLQDAYQIVQRTHAFLIETLAGIDPDDLALATHGRVRCAPHNRDALRLLVAERTPITEGTPLPWKLGGRLKRALRRQSHQTSEHLCTSLPEAGRPDPGTAALIEFLRCASDIAQTGPWLCRLDVDREVELLSEIARGEAMRVATWPNDVHIEFDPLDKDAAAVYGAVSAFAAHLSANAQAFAAIDV